MLKKIVLLVGGLTTLAATALGAADLAAADARSSAARAPRPIVVEVTGDAANGFEITYADGTGRYPSTDSEALAECSEYDTRVSRVRCRAQVRTWYRDLGDLQASLAYVREHG